MRRTIVTNDEESGLGMPAAPRIGRLKDEGRAQT